MSRFAKIAAIVGVHMVAGCTAALFSEDYPCLSSGIFLAIAFSQASLLGLWGGSAPSLLGIPFAAVAGTLLGIEFILGVGQVEIELVLLVVLPCVLLALGTRVVRWLGTRTEPVARGGFSLHQLFLLTTGVAVTVVAVKAMGIELGRLEVVDELAAIVMGVAITGGVVTWAIRRSATPHGRGSRHMRMVWRCLAAIAISVLTGVWTSWQLDVDETPFWVGTSVGHAVILLGSLIALRYAGWSPVQQTDRVAAGKVDTAG